MTSLIRDLVEDEAGCEIIEQHECSNNELPEQLLLYKVVLDSEREQKHWELFSLWFATDLDVAEGDAEEVGELLNLSSIKIAYCPFCGEKLS